MVDKENAKLQIKELVEKYNKVVEEKRVARYKEEETKKDFILPLFRALGWDVENSLEVTAEETISKKRVDYGFRINGIPKFFLEAKALKADLNDRRFIEQAIDYAWTKGCTWAVLSDFESVMIFNAEWKTEDLLQNLLKSVPCQEFLDRFDELWLLSRESFEQGLLDKEAEKWGKKAKLAPIDQQLLDDFARWRNALSKNILNYNRDKKLTEEELDEAVQRLLNRLVFIRKAEDAELEGKVLLSTLREWESDGGKALYVRLGELFRKFEKTYDSELFEETLVDEVVITNDVLKEVITGLYKTKDKLRRYDFSIIDADVLGNVYEQYLSHILKKTKKRADVKERHARRKEQGIYYTPTYIVDYIVRNTLGELLKDKKVDVEKIRVLDPACGSGSFLIKAFDVLNEHCSKHDKDYAQTQIDTTCQGSTFTTKTKILQNNIFGVDLDKQAVEIARLNLLLKIAEKGQRLPLLRQNIRCGNSIIEDEKVAKDKAFKWKKEFKQIMEDEGGFDVVIGNPPYVRVDSLRKEDKEYWDLTFDSPEGKYDLYYLFIESAFRFLKDGGKCGFIVPNKWCAASSAKKLREIIFKSSVSCELISVSNLDVFKDAANYPLILILTKGKNLKKITVSSAFLREDFLNLNFKSYTLAKQDLFSLPSKIIPINIDQRQFDLVIRLLDNCEKLQEYLKISEGLRIPQEFETEKNDKFEIVKQYQFDRYSEIERGSYISENNLRKVTSFESGRYKNSQKDKALIAEDALQMTCSLDEKRRIPQGGVYFGVLINDDVSLKYIISLLNSKLLSFIYKTLFGGMHMGGGYLRYRTEFLEQLPIKKVSKDKQNQFVERVDRIISLKKRLCEIGDKKTDERQRIEEEVKKTDAEIDELVYKLYGITEPERKIIEDSFG